MSDFLDKLRTIVGERGLITDAQGQPPYLTDWRDNYLGTALAVVRPATTEEVAAVVKLCATEKVAIVPQGGNTGMVGGGTPHENGHEIVLSLNRMNRIVEIDEIGYSMTVEAGGGPQTIQETPPPHPPPFPLCLPSPPAFSPWVSPPRGAAPSAATSRPMPAACRCCITATPASSCSGSRW